MYLFSDVAYGKVYVIFYIVFFPHNFIKVAFDCLLFYSGNIHSDIA